jgi:outer membrane protein TolC
MKRNKVVFFLLLGLMMVPVFKIRAQDSLRYFSLQEAISVVKSFHPVARQAKIGIESAKAGQLAAKGAFDPVLNYRAAEKTFDGQQYYQYNEPKLVIPTWYGIEISAGMEYLTGGRTDPQETQGRTSFAGISVPLAKNLLMDKRRAALEQARIMRNGAVNEQRLLINDLLYEMMGAYWAWVESHQQLKVAEESLQVSTRRLELVKKAWKQGDRPAIDTIEALAQVQSFELLLNDARLQIQNTAIALSAYLWTNNDRPYDLPSFVVPPANWETQNSNNGFVPVLNQLLEALPNHPELKEYAYKLQWLTVERKLKFQELLPTLDFRYQQLGKGYNLAKTVAAGPLFENNFTYGISFGVPLRLSAGRGAYRQAKLKISETQIQQDYKQLQLQNKVKAYFNDWLMLQRQVDLQQAGFANYQFLLRGEETRFFNGESSLFMVNNREVKLLEMRQKLVALKIKLLKTTASLQWAAGLLG